MLICLCLTFDVQSIAPTTINVPQNSVLPQITNPELSDRSIDERTNQDRLISLSAEENQSYMKCGTMMILKNRAKLISEINSQLAVASNSRPTDPGGGIDGERHLLPKLYNTTNFVLHWTNGTDGGNPEDAVPSQDLDGNGMPDIVESFGVIFEYVWDFLINARGFPAPPSDEAEPNDANQRNPDGRYDVFIYWMNYYGYAYPEQYPNSPSYSYIAVRNTLGKLGLRQIVAAHEFYHAIQFVYDCTEESWWMETTATYMEDEVYPDVNDNYQYLAYWFRRSDTYGLETFDGWHEYGNFIFAKRLSEDFGDNIIKEIWEEMNSTDGLQAVDNVLISKNSSMVSAFSTFITANFFLEDMYVDGVDYREALIGKVWFKGVWIEYQYDASTKPNNTEISESNVNRDAWMDKWATDYITLKLDPVKPKYRIFFDGLDLSTNYLIKLATKKGDNITERIFTLDDKKDGYVDLSYDTFDNVTLIIANAGNTITADPSWRVVITFLPAEPVPFAILFVEPANITDSTLIPFQEFTIKVKIQNVTNLYDLDIQMSWNASILNYTSHTVKIPVEDYPDGVLHEPVLLIKDKVNQTAGNYWLSYNSTSPAAAFNGSGTIFNMTLKVIGIGSCYFNISLSELTNIDNQPIEHEAENGYFKNIFYDVAIIDVKASTYLTVPEQTININVTVKNNGTARDETFNVSTYWGSYLIETQSITKLSPGTEETLNINWTIPPELYGIETIWANGTIVPQDANPENNRYEDQVLIIEVHDLANKNFTVPNNLIGEELNMSIIVVLSNQGTFTETTNITLYLNETIIGIYPITIPSDTDEETNLKLCIPSELGLNLYCNYTLRVEISPVPGEENLEDNISADEWIIITIPGDIDGDKDVDLYDAVALLVRYGVKKDNPKYDPNCDIDGDGSIDLYDAVRLLTHYGEKYP